MHLLQPVDRRGDVLVPGLELQRQVQRVVPGLVQVAAVEPEAFCWVGFHMLRCSPSHGPGSLVVSEPRPHTLPTVSATSWEMRSAAQPFIDP